MSLLVLPAIIEFYDKGTLVEQRHAEASDPIIAIIATIIVIGAITFTSDATGPARGDRGRRGRRSAGLSPQPQPHPGSPTTVPPSAAYTVTPLDRWCQLPPPSPVRCPYGGPGSAMAMTKKYRTRIPRTFEPCSAR